jgi:predicted acetyltransferase
MTHISITTDLPTPLAVRPAAATDTDALRRLWLVFRHHMSEFTGTLPSSTGEYRAERLESALDPDRPDWAAWLLTAGPHPIGFALTRALDQPTRVLNSFFLVAPARRRGLGLAFARAVLTADPGTWSVAHQEANGAAAGFWPRVAASFDPEWRREIRASGDQQDGPRDTWLTFRTT